MTTISSIGTHFLAALGFVLSPIAGVYLQTYTSIPLLLSVTVLWIGVFVWWRKMLPAKIVLPVHEPIPLPGSLTIGSGHKRVHCDHEGIRLGPDTLVAAAPFDFKEDVREFRANRYEMFIAWSEIATLMDLNRHEGEYQIIYKENLYKAWLIFQPPGMSPGERRLLKAFILQGGRSPMN